MYDTIDKDASDSTDIITADTETDNNTLISGNVLKAVMQIRNTASIQGMQDGELTPEGMVNLGKAAGTLYSRIAVGRNFSPNSLMMQNCFKAGARSVGADILDMGAVPAMIMPFCNGNTKCNVMIGNPEDRNRIAGAIFFNPDGGLFTENQMKILLERLQNVNIVTNENKIGTCNYVSGINEDYIRKIVNDSDSIDCGVSIDCASGPCSTVAPTVLNDLGADVTTINCQIDGRFPGRELSPDEVNLRSLIKNVKTGDAGSIGIALNGDGTRIAAVDEDGRYISSGNLLALILKYLNPKDVVVPVNTPMVVRDTLKCNIIYCPLSKQSIAETMKEKDSEFGGMDDGTVIFKSLSYCSDGIMSAVTLAKMASELALSDVIDEIPRYYNAKGFVRHYESREHLTKKLSENLYALEYNRITDCDGWRVDFNDGWLFVRFNDYDRAVDIYAEGRDKAYTISLLEMGKDLVTSSLMTIGR